jgi:antirestriction protein ArdC
MASVYEIVTEKILHELESGNIPWEMPWQIEAPRSLVSGKPYRGINTLLLGMAGFSSPYWLTYKQAADRGGNVRKGEHGTLIVFWKWNSNPTSKADAETDGEVTADRHGRAPLLRYYTVFNVEQCEKIDAPAGRPAVPSIDAAEAIVKGYENPPAIESGNLACYSTTSDVVTMPARNTFEKSEEFYSVLFHELTHSTRHTSRLNRGDGKPNAFGGEEYSKEELVAEMGAAMLCGVAGITSTVRRSAGYIQNWIQVLKNDTRMVVLAAAQAQKAADWILGPAADESELDATGECVPYCGEGGL